MNFCYRGFRMGSELMNTHWWHRDMGSYAEGKRSPLVKQRDGPCAQSTQHSTPGPLRQSPILASLLAADKQGHKQRENRSCLVWEALCPAGMTLGDAGGNPQCFRVSDLRGYTLLARGHTSHWSTEPRPHRESKASPASPRPTQHGTSAAVACCPPRSL